MPPKTKKKKIRYPDSCYDLIPTGEVRGVMRYTKFPNEEKMREYRAKYDIETLEEIKKKQDEILREKEAKKRREAEERKRKRLEPELAKAVKSRRGRASGKKKKKTTPKKKLLKTEEDVPEEEVMEVLEKKEKKKAKKIMGEWERENEMMKAREAELKRLENELDDLYEELITVSGGEEEEVDDVIDFRDRIHQERQQIAQGNNINAAQSIQNVVDNKINDWYDDDDVVDIPFGESIYHDRKRDEGMEDEELKRDNKRVREKRKRHYSNYFLTIVYPADLARYTEDELEVIAAELQRRVNSMLYFYAPDYIEILEENGDLDLVEQIQFITKPERQLQRGDNGLLHSHSIIQVTHYTRVQLDYELINELIAEIAKDMGFKKKDGGIAKFQVQIQRASDSAINEYDYLAEDGVSYEAGDISEYYENAEAAIKSGAMDRADLRTFRRRKKEVASAQKTVRELRGQKFNF